MPAALGLTKAQIFALSSSGRYDAEVVERRIALIEDVVVQRCRQQASERREKFDEHAPECRDAHAQAARATCTISSAPGPTRRPVIARR